MLERKNLGYIYINTLDVMRIRRDFGGELQY